MRKKPPVLKKERGRFFEHGFEHGRRTERSESAARMYAGRKKASPGGGFLRKLLLVSFKGVAFAADAVYDVAEDFGIGF